MVNQSDFQRRRDRFRGRGAGGRFSSQNASNGRFNSRGLESRKESEKKGRYVSLKNRIRSIERLLRKDLPADVKSVQEKKLEELKKLLDDHAKITIGYKMALKYRKVKFFERRKVERSLRRIERQLRCILENPSEDQTGTLTADLNLKLSQLKEDLQYIKYFPKSEQYISLFMGNDDSIIAKREEMRKKIKENMMSAAASGHDLEETGSEDDGMFDLSEDDFFMAGSSSDDADADDELGDDTSLEIASNSHDIPQFNASNSVQQHTYNSSRNPPNQTRHNQSNPSQQSQTSRALQIASPTPQISSHNSNHKVQKSTHLSSRPPLPKRTGGRTSTYKPVSLQNGEPNSNRNVAQSTKSDSQVPSHNPQSEVQARSLMPPPRAGLRVQTDVIATDQPRSRDNENTTNAQASTSNGPLNNSSSSQVDDSTKTVNRKRKRTRPKKKK